MKTHLVQEQQLTFIGKVPIIPLIAKCEISVLT